MAHVREEARVVAAPARTDAPKLHSQGNENPTEGARLQSSQLPQSNAQWSSVACSGVLLSVSAGFPERGTAGAVLPP